MVGRHCSGRERVRVLARVAFGVVMVMAVVVLMMIRIVIVGVPLFVLDEELCRGDTRAQDTPG